MKKGLHQNALHELYKAQTELREITKNNPTLEAFQQLNNVAGKIVKMEMNKMLYHTKQFEKCNMPEMEKWAT